MELKQIHMDLLKGKKPLSIEEVIRFEMFVKVGCPNFNNCVRELNKYLIDENQRKKAMDFPTTTEGDR